MKLFALPLLISMTMAFPGLSSLHIWLASFQQPIKSLIDNPLRQSTIPQFILDTRHPWILANLRKLERLPNAEAILCADPSLYLDDSTKPESERTNVQLNIPSDLFDSLEVNNNREGISRPGWSNALERLGEMSRCPRALTQVKTLEVKIHIHEGPYSDKLLRVLEPSVPPYTLLTLFGDVLESMINLETLKWAIPKEYTHFFEQEFQSRNLTLPSIKRLEPGPSSHYMVGMCPNIEILENGGGTSWYHGYRPDDKDWHLMLIQAAIHAPKVKRFAMVGGHDGWTPLYVSEVVKSMPHLESLGMLDRLGKETYLDDGGDEGKLKAVLDLLPALGNLTHLDLPASSRLGLGFDGGHWCGNAYMGPEGRMYQREVTRQDAETAERAGDIVILNAPQLNSFTIGRLRPVLTREEGKLVSAKWPWTGRMEEWLVEVVPDWVHGDW